jgi:hypothetical protein
VLEAVQVLKRVLSWIFAVNNVGRIDMAMLCENPMPWKLDMLHSTPDRNESNNFSTKMKMPQLELNVGIFRPTRSASLCGSDGCGATMHLFQINS